MLLITLIIIIIFITQYFSFTGSWRQVFFWWDQVPDKLCQCANHSWRHSRYWPNIHWPPLSRERGREFSWGEHWSTYQIDQSGRTALFFVFHLYFNLSLDEDKMNKSNINRKHNQKMNQEAYDRNLDATGSCQLGCNVDNSSLSLYSRGSPCCKWLLQIQTQELMPF